MSEVIVAERRGGQRLTWVVSARSADQPHRIPSNDVARGDLVVVFGPAGDRIEAIATITGGKRGERGVEVTLGDPRVSLGEPRNISDGTLNMLTRLASCSAERDVVRQQQGQALLEAIDRVYPLRATEARALLGASDTSALLPSEFYGELEFETHQLYDHAARLGSYTNEDANLSFGSVAATLFNMRGTKAGDWFVAHPAIDESSLIASLGFADPHEASLAAGKVVIPKTVLNTASTRQVLSSARDWKQRTGAPAIGIRHILASYFVNPPANHRKDLEGWGFNERWANSFYTFVADGFPAERWREQVDLPTPAAPSTETVALSALGFPLYDAEPAVRLAIELFHRRRNQQRTWLGSTIVAFALVELRNRNSKSIFGLEPLYELIDAAKEKYQASFDEHFGPPVDRAAPEPPLSPNCVHLLETARALAEVTADNRIDVEHLLAALACEPVRGTGNVLDDWLKIDVLRERIVARVAPKERYRWADLLLRRTIVTRRAAVISDDPSVNIAYDKQWVSDPFNRKQDVRSLATLVADPALEAPFAIGVFAPWGAGKTTFLQRIQQEIGTGSDIVHVRFNAWHYADSTLHACLMQEILTSIGDHLGGRVEAVTAILNAIEATTVKVARAVATEKAVAGERAGAAAAVSAAKEAAATERAKVRERAEQAAAGDVAVELLIGAPSDDRLEQLSAIRRELRAVSSLFGFLSAFLHSWQHVIGALVVAGLTALAYKEGGRAGASLGGTVGLFAVLRHYYEAAKRTDATWRARVERGIAETPEVRAAEARVLAAEATLAEVVQRAAAASEVSEEARRAADRATVRALVGEFVAKRIADATYAKELGVVSRIRADLQQLDDALLAGRLTEAGAIRRIVLYVDDLDRCEPDVVVNVLQAIHLLLAFKLFVVIVGVDATWALHSIKHKYPWLSEHTDHLVVKPEEYLEKIFQLVLWLEAPAASSVAMYLRELQTRPVQRVEGAPAVPLSPRPPPGEGSATAAADDTRAIVPESSSVALDEPEIDFLRSLARHLGAQPRRLKRLINTYRFVKSGLSDLELAVFLEIPAEAGGGSGAYQSVLALLAIVTGAPTRAPAILHDLATRQAGTTVIKCKAKLLELAAGERECVERVLDTYRSTKGDGVTIDELRRWASRISQFTLTGPAGISAAATPAMATAAQPGA